MPTQEQRREATRNRLIETARALILAEGVEGTTTRTILDAAGVSRGAMYHHYASVEDLIAAIYEIESKRAIQQALDKNQDAASPFEQLIGTCLSWLEALADIDVAKILIIEGPSAIGWERCRKIETKHSLAQMKAWLEAANARGEIQMENADLVVRMLNAILTEAALAVVKAKGARAAHEEARRTVLQFVSGLRKS